MQIPQKPNPRLLSLNKKTYNIVFFFLFLFFNASIPKPVHGNAHQHTSGVTIASNKSIFTPSDIMQISISVKASRIKADVVDLHVILQNPNGNFSTYYKKLKWIVRDKPFCEVAAIPLKNKQIGPYSWYIALCSLGSDPFNLKELVAVAKVDLFLTPSHEISLPYKNKYSPVSEISPPLLIAHAGGAFEGRVGQNSLEALDSNYEKGHRYFEIDFCWTSDDRLVLIHDWERSLRELFMDVTKQPSLEQFESMKMKHNMTQLSLGSLFQWLREHRDAKIITDVKEKNLNALRIIADNSAKLRNNFIPQIYNLSEFETVKRLGFEKIILTLYRSSLSDEDVIKFAVDKRPFAVTMTVRRAFSSFLPAELRRKGVIVYAHTINSIEAFCYLVRKGIHGIYTDEIVFEDLDL